jgi:hypothetical protein
MIMVEMGFGHEMMCLFYSCIPLYSFNNCYTSTQNKGLRKVMLKFIALKLMSYFNSINSSETPITFICFI